MNPPIEWKEEWHATRAWSTVPPEERLSEELYAGGLLRDAMRLKGMEVIDRFQFTCICKTQLVPNGVRRHLANSAPCFVQRTQKRMIELGWVHSPYSFRLVPTGSESKLGGCMQHLVPPDLCALMRADVPWKIAAADTKYGGKGSMETHILTQKVWVPKRVSQVLLWMVFVAGDEPITMNDRPTWFGKHGAEFLHLAVHDGEFMAAAHALWANRRVEDTRWKLGLRFIDLMETW